MRTALTTWLDRDRMVPVYGVKVHRNGRWFNVCKGAEPLLFDDKAEAEAERATLRKRRTPTPPEAP